jgi:hypothetical protein
MDLPRTLTWWMAKSNLSVLAIAFLLAGCDPAHDLAIRNGSGQDVLVRVTETEFATDFGNLVSVFVVPAGSYGWAFQPQIGELKGTVEVLRPDCQVVGLVTAQGGSVVDIASDGMPAIRYFDRDETGPSRTLAQSGECGGEIPS